MPGRPDLGRQEKPQGTGNEDEHSSASELYILEIV